MRALLSPLILLALLAAGGASGGTVVVDPFGRTVETSRLRIVFDGDHPEYLREVVFKDWSPTKDLDGGDSGAREFWGQTLRGVDSLGFIQPTQTEAASWTVTSNSEVFAEIVTTNQSALQPPVTTTYHFWADRPYFEVLRVIHFGSRPDSCAFQGYVPRIAFINTYRALRWRDTTGTVLQRGFCFSGCETQGWDGRWLQHVGYTNTRGVSIAQIYPQDMAPGTPISRGYGPNSFSGWVSPLKPAAYRADDDSTRVLIAFSTDPENVAALDSLWAGYQSGAIALAASPATGRPGLQLAASPNPTLAGARLEWTQALAGDATVDILDMAGRRVARLAAGPASGGAHAAHWSGRDERGVPSPPGVYFARLVTGEGVRTARIAKVR